MFALEGLASVDGWTGAAIAAKAAWYAAALMAMGGVLFVAVFGRKRQTVWHITRKLTAFAAIVTLFLLALRFGIGAARISGMGVAGMVDTMMLGFLWESPLGTSALWQVAGAALVLAILWRGTIGLSLASIGAVLIALSFVQIGHSHGEPRWVLATLLTIHLLTVAFWVGALAPLRAIVNQDGAAATLHRFGVIASGTVPLLILAGVGFAWLVSGSFTALLGTAYGWTLIGKIAVVATLLALAALNKLRLVPALEAGRPNAAAALRRSIAWEGLAVAVILVLTATLTTITTPPLNL